MHDDLTQKLLFAENDFLAALRDSSQMLASYTQTWSALPDALHIASKAGSISNETLCLAHSVASRIANIASCFLDVKRGEEFFTTSLQKDCDTMFCRMAALDLNANPKSLLLVDSNDTHSCPYPSPPTSNVDGSLPPFLATAHQWVLDNLHNPYPTAKVKAQMAAASSCQVSSINSWFINARRRIGWTTLCREHFSNCRADMIDAAHRALVEEDPHRVLSPELRHSFVAIKVAAEGLYSSALTGSPFAEDLDAVVRDMTQEERKPVETEKLSELNKGNSMKVTRNSYPSPDPSGTSSPVPAPFSSLTDENDEGGDIAPPIFPGSKRSRSSVEPADELSSTVNRPIKRLRASATSSMCLPSLGGIRIPSDDISPETSIPLDLPLPAETIQESPPCTRYPFTTRPQSSSGSLTRLLTVPDCLPRSHTENEYSIDGWFNTNFNALFDIPSPVVVTEPDPSVPWEVQLFKDYTIPGNTKYAPICPSPPTAAPDNLSDLDSLLQSICSESFVPPSNILPTNITGHSYMPSLDPSDILQTNPDWMSLLHGTEAYQPTVYSTFPQDPNSQPLSEIDLSVLQLPYVMPAVDAWDDFVSKQVKLHQFHSMQTTVRRMEQELRLEGVVV